MSEPCRLDGPKQRRHRGAQEPEHQDIDKGGQNPSAGDVHFGDVHFLPRADGPRCDLSSHFFNHLPFQTLPRRAWDPSAEYLPEYLLNLTSEIISFPPVEGPDSGRSQSGV